GHRFRSSSDTEVLLHLYLEQGERFLEAIDGMFALAIWDERKQQMLLARDRLGIKPLCYFADREHLLFASEMKSLLADPRVPTDVDPAALGEYFHLLSIPDPNCILRGVRKLLPGHYLTVSRDGITEHRYWDLAIAPDPGRSFDADCEVFDRLFTASVRSHMVADVPVGAFLSGGGDSSAIVCAASQQTSSPIETFSITFPGLPELDDSPEASPGFCRAPRAGDCRSLAPRCGGRRFGTDRAAGAGNAAPPSRAGVRLGGAVPPLFCVLSARRADRAAAARCGRGNR